EGNLITTVGLNGSIPERAKVIDLGGATLMPGLIDCHVHCGGVVDYQLKEGEVPFGGREATDNYAGVRKHAIENGVTTVRSMADFFPDIVQVRDEINSGKLQGPRFVCAGPFFTAPGGHPGYTIWGGIQHIVDHGLRQVSEPDAAREEVKKLVDGGVDFIKTGLADVDVWRYPRKVPKLDLKVLAAIVDEAHKHGLRTAVHAETPQDGLDAVKAGVDSIEHLVLAGAANPEAPEGLAELMLQNNAYFVPCAATPFFYKDWFPQLPKRYGDLEKITKSLYDAGVNISLGTDAGAPKVQFGEAVHLEMELMAKLGMKPMDIIVSATKRAAENLAKADIIGTIEVGKLADMIVVAGNPSVQITDSRNIKLVIKDGKILVDKLN
ncbi:MAG: amidohydrolase family protein, partial [Deltaproteobacteria bacterium]|nr:amidohydrolase family protein [Deltaproteobacteria bacterium]